jgi:anaerobic selenocysteine-containing dehydrogenase
MDPGVAESGDEDGVHIHPGDAAERKIEDGDRVRVFNDRGQLKLAAQIDDRVQRGVLTVTNGRWISLDGLSVNMLTHDDVSDMGYGAIHFDCLVQVEKLTD